jgi:hypothetical protein
MRAFDVKPLGEMIFESETPWRGDVVVIIPLFNCAPFILDCLRSVVDQTLERISVVIVDDDSTDDGPKLAVDFLRRHANRFCSARIVRHLRNQGLSMARNSGIAWSAGPLVFMLDADNRVRPPALARLKSALEIDGADFAYSQLFIFGVKTGVGEADIWDVDRLRYGNKIDAMAMVRRSALSKSGGYGVVADDQGLEDYDLWCRFFTLRMRGVFVPELLCEYRSHGWFRQDTQANKSFDILTSKMALQYPEVFNPEARIASGAEDLSISIPLNYTLTPTNSSPTIAVVVHMFYPQLIDEILAYIRHVPYPVDLYVSTDSFEKRAYIEGRLQEFLARTELRVTLRQGRDIAPRLIGFRDVYDNYEYVLLLHSKVSPHSRALQNWRAHLFDNLMGSPKIVESILEAFYELPNLGVVAPQHFEVVRDWLGWGENFEICKALAARFGVELKANGFLDYPSGSMFWARTAALRPFFDAQLVLEDFSPDTSGRQLDGTMAHAIERLVFVAAEKAGFSWVKVAQPHLFKRKDTIKTIHDPAELRAFIAQQRRILSALTSDKMGNFVDLRTPEFDPVRVLSQGCLVLNGGAAVGG